MRLTEITAAVAGLRGTPAEQVRGAVADLLPALQHLAGDVRVAEAQRIQLLTRAARALAPTTPRADTAAVAIATLEQLLATRPGRGRPEIGPPTTVRLALDAYDDVDQAERAGQLVDAAGAPRRAAAIRLLVDEALEHRRQR